MCLQECYLLSLGLHGSIIHRIVQYIMLYYNIQYVLIHIEFPSLFNLKLIVTYIFTVCTRTYRTWAYAVIFFSSHEQNLKRTSNTIPKRLWTNSSYFLFVFWRDFKKSFFLLSRVSWSMKDMRISWELPYFTHRSLDFLLFPFPSFIFSETKKWISEEWRSTQVHSPSSLD